MTVKSAFWQVLMATLALVVTSLGARASTLPISGSAGYQEASAFSINLSAPGLSFLGQTCDAPDPGIWTGPSTISLGWRGSICMSTSLTDGSHTSSYTWLESTGPNPLFADFQATPGACGPMQVNADDTWSETCPTDGLSGDFGTNLSLAGVPPFSISFTGSGTIVYSGTIHYNLGAPPFILLSNYTVNFTGTAQAPDPSPEPSSLLLVSLVLAAFAGIAWRETRSPGRPSA